MHPLLLRALAVPAIAIGLSLSAFADETLYYEDRADIPERYTWDLSLYFKDEAAWDRAFAELDGKLAEGRLRAAIYDGDTTAWFRKKIRQDPPNILLTNPEMVHLALLAYHRQWQTLFANLDFTT